MAILTDLQQRLGFTGTEIRVILFLSLTLLAGMGIRWLRSGSGAPGAVPPVFDYTRSDSEFTARASAHIGATSHPPAAPRSRLRKAHPPLQSIDINTASHDQLLLLPGIGPSLATRIIAYRAEHGFFSSIEALVNVKGIGPKKLESLRPYAVIGRAR